MAKVFRAGCGPVLSPFPLDLPPSDQPPAIVLEYGRLLPRDALVGREDSFTPDGDGGTVGILGEALVVTVLRTRVRIDEVRGLDPAVREHLVTDHLLPRLASAAGRGLCLHAAAVAVDGAVVVLLGESGAGKSSLAAALSLTGAELVADDCAQIHESSVYATGRGIRLAPDAIERLGLSGAKVDATGKALVGAEHGLRIAAGSRPLGRIVVVGERDRQLTLGQAFVALSAQRFWLQRPTREQLLAENMELLHELPPTVEVDWATPDPPGRIRELARQLGG